MKKYGFYPIEFCLKCVIETGEYQIISFPPEFFHIKWSSVEDWKDWKDRLRELSDNFP